MTDKEQIEQLNWEIKFCSSYRTRANNTVRNSYFNKVQANNISKLIPILIRVIREKHCS